MKRLISLLEGLMLVGLIYLIYELMVLPYRYFLATFLEDGFSWQEGPGTLVFKTYDAYTTYLETFPIEYTLLCWVILLAGTLTILIASRQPLLKTFNMGWLSLRNTLAAMIMGIGLVLFVTSGTLFVAGFIPALKGVTVFAMMEGYDFSFLVITLGIVVPIVEELFFRGLIYHRLSAHFSPVTAIVIGAVLFSLSHLNPYQSLAVLPLSLAAGLLVNKSGSVLSAIWLHSTYNLMNIYLAKVAFFQYNNVQLLVLMVLGTMLVGFGIAQLQAGHRKPVESRS